MAIVVPYFVTYATPNKQINKHMVHFNVYNNSIISKVRTKDNKFIVKE